MSVREFLVGIFENLLSVRDVQGIDEVVTLTMKRIWM